MDSLILIAIGLYGAEFLVGQGQVLLSSSSLHISDWLNFPEDENSVINQQSDRDGLPAELIEHLQKDSTPAAKEELQLLRAILNEACQTVSSTDTNWWDQRL